MKASRILVENIRTILARRKDVLAKDLAKYVGIDASWLSKLINEESGPERAEGMPFRHLDKMASFFGLEARQLIAPGISAVAERRKGAERRTGYDRRIGRRTEAIRHPPTRETLSPRLAELVLIGEQLQGKYFDEMVRWANAQLVRQGLGPGAERRSDPGAAAPPPLPKSARRKKKKPDDEEA